MSCAFVANLMMTCYGLICPASGFLIPQLEDPDIGFSITKEEGSWLGKVWIKSLSPSPFFSLILSIFYSYIENSFSLLLWAWKLIEYINLNKLCTISFSYIASIMILGSITGSLCGGWQCAKFGRKKSLIFDCFFFIIGIIMSSFAPNLYVLLAARILLGQWFSNFLTMLPFLDIFEPHNIFFND